MPPGTLRVPLPDVTQSVTGCIPTQSMGTIITARWRAHAISAGAALPVKTIELSSLFIVI
jgi:hypothetical protein